MEVETPTLNQTTLLANEAEAFALEPVAITRRHNQTTLKLFSFHSQMYCILCKHLLRYCCKSWNHPPETAKRAKPKTCDKTVDPVSIPCHTHSRQAFLWPSTVSFQQTLRRRGGKGNASWLWTRLKSWAMNPSEPSFLTTQIWSPLWTWPHQPCSSCIGRRAEVQTNSLHSHVPL